jgi:hypothetical protein
LNKDVVYDDRFGADVEREGSGLEELEEGWMASQAASAANIPLFIAL